MHFRKVKYFKSIIIGFLLLAIIFFPFLEWSFFLFFELILLLIIILTLLLYAYTPLHPAFIISLFFAIGILFPSVLDFYFPFLERLEYFNVNEETKEEAIVVGIIGLIGALSGILLSRKTLFNILIKGRTLIKIKKNHYFIISLAAMFAGILRYKYQLGMAGFKPSIPFAGFAQFLLYDSFLAITSIFFIDLIKNFKWSKFYWLAIIVSILTITQTIFGWKSTLIANIIVFSTSFFIFKLNMEKVRFPLIAIILALLFVPFLFNKGNEQRNYTEIKDSNLIEDILIRQQGYTRLCKVVSSMTNSYTISNDFYIYEISKSGLSISSFTDQKIFGIKSWQQTSIGSSGIGALYLSGGFIFVFFGYFILMVILNLIYNLIHNGNNPILFISIYSQLVLLTNSFITENYNLYMFKLILVVLVLTTFYYYIFTKKIN